MTNLLSLATSLPVDTTPETVAEYKAEMDRFLTITGAPTLTSQAEVREWIVDALKNLPEDMESIDKMMGVFMRNAELFVEREIAAGNKAESEIGLCLYEMGKSIMAEVEPARAA